MDPSTAQCSLLTMPTQPAGWRWEVVIPPDDARTPLPAPLHAPQPNTARSSGIPHLDPPPPKTALSMPERTLRMASARFANLVAEALDGKRRLAGLQPWFDPVCLAALAHRTTTMKGTGVRLASVRVQPISDSSAEVALRLTTPHLDHAAALRVTRRGDQWVCTALIIG